MKRVMQKAILISAMLIIPILNLWAQETAEKFFNSVSDEYGDVTDYKAYVTITKGNNVSSGVLNYKTPNKLRIDFDSPKDQVLVVNNELLELYIPDFRVSFKQKLKKHNSATLASMVSGQGLDLLKRNYRMGYLVGPDPVALDDESEEMVVKLKLTWNSQTEGFRELEMSINPADKTIRRIIGVTGSFETIRFDFEDIDTLTKIPDMLFEYDAPSEGNSIENFLFEPEN
ncbi:MAG: outer-membrane lipoprotein carrier protein LolA [Spirochaetaceae bacterium]|nr:outer-membrane lipoprotein carrier protein LolA [Spirochaetaceae bacterium]